MGCILYVILVYTVAIAKQLSISCVNFKYASKGQTNLIPNCINNRVKFSYIGRHTKLTEASQFDCVLEAVAWRHRTGNP